MNGKDAMKMFLIVSLIINAALAGLMVNPGLRWESDNKEIKTQEQTDVPASIDSEREVSQNGTEEDADGYREQNELYIGTWEITELIPADFPLMGYEAVSEAPEAESILNSKLTITKEYIECLDERYYFTKGPTSESYAIVPGRRNRIHYHLAEALGFDSGYYTLVRFGLSDGEWSVDDINKVTADDFSFLYLKDENTIYAGADYGFLYRLERTTEDTEYITMRFDYFHTESMYDMFEFMKNPQENNLYMGGPEVFRFIEKDGKLILRDIAYTEWVDGEAVPTEFFDVNGDDIFAQDYNSGEYCSKAVAFLCDEAAIRQCFNDNGIDDIQNIVIISDRHGYIVAAVTEQNAYYMTVPTVAETYGDYIFQKIYTKDEFKKVYGPRPVKVFVNEKEVSFSSQPIFVGMPQGIGERYYLEMDILELSEMLGVRGTYDEKLKVIIVGDYEIQIGDDKWSIDPKYDEFIKSADSYDVFITTPEESDRSNGSAVYRNGRCLGSFTLISELCRYLGYQIEADLEDYSIHIYKQKSR